jgi:3-oxoacyl-[acyl-carrier protein] reductase
MDLKNKTVLITGASKGIGKAIAEQFAKAGANIIINYRSDDASAAKVAKDSSVQKLLVKADITKEDEVERMFKEIKKNFSQIDILVNNAAIFDSSDSPENLKVFENIFQTNFLAQIRVTNKALKMMKKGKVIFISSVHGKIGHGRPDTSAYSAMKAALDSYMKILAKHLAPDILVNSVSPGKTLTPMWGKMDENKKQMLVKDDLIKRWIAPEEIADGVLFLAKNDAVCAEILTIDLGTDL